MAESTRRRTAVQPKEQNVVEGPMQATGNLEQFMDEDGVIHNPLASQGRHAWRNTHPTSEIRGPDDSFFDATGITREQGLPQPGPALDALRAAGAIDDAAHEKRRQAIEQPAQQAMQETRAREERERVLKSEAETRTTGKDPEEREAAAEKREETESKARAEARAKAGTA